MLFLKSEKDGTIFHLLTGHTHKINRKEGDFVLTNDLSISRNHSAILLAPDGEIWVWDEGSKYGTFILSGKADRKLKENERAKIKVGDRVRFGVQWNIFMVCKTEFVVCTSTILPEDKKTLQKILMTFGGRLKSNWDAECTHLTMNQVSLTHKVVFALAEGKPIVTLKFWQKVEEAVKTHSALPKMEDYQPPIEEEELKKQTKSNTLLPSENRKNLFQGLTFIFSNEDTKSKLKPLVECAGGICKSIQSSKLSAKQCCESKYVVVKDGEASGPLMRDIMSTLKQEGLRAVEISEIGLAIYNNSLVRYCNPLWSKPVILGRTLTQSQGICLAENTEDLTKESQNIKVKPNASLVIPQSLESNVSVDSNRSAKRPASPTDTRPTKRPSQKQGSLQNWVKRSDAKDSEATMSFGTAANIVAGAPSSSQKSNDVKKEDLRKKKQEDKDSFKLPLPKKSNDVEKEFPPQKKRGRVENDPSELPATKKSAPADRTVDPFEESLGDDSGEESKRPGKEAVIEDDSDDEISIPDPGKKNARRVNEESRKRPAIEEDSDDEFSIPDPGKKNARRVNEESREIPKIEEDSEDEFSIPDLGKKNAKRVSEEAKKRATIEEDSDDEFSIPDVGKKDAKRTRVSETVSSKKTVPEAGPSTSRQAGKTSEKSAQPMRVNGTSSLTVNGSSRANLPNPRGTCRTPSISEFIDKSMSASIKKEEGHTPEEEEELSRYMGKINIVEAPLMRRPVPVPRRAEASDIVVDGRPNFKRFKKHYQRVPKRITNFVLDQSLSLYTGVPEPDPDVPDDVQPAGRQTAGRQTSRRETERRQPEPEDSEDLFPLTNRPMPENRRNRPRDQVVDEWTV